MKLADFKLLDEADEAVELTELLDRWNDTSRPYDRDRTVIDLIDARAVTTPDAIAIVFEEREYSYAQLTKRANQIARLLASLELPEPAIAGVLMENTFDMLAVLLGVLKAGGVYLPANPEVPVERTRFMFADAPARVLFTERKLIREANRLQWDCPELRTLLCVDSDDVLAEQESESELMKRELWEFVGERAGDDIAAGGWIDSYTGANLSEEAMREYGENVVRKLAPAIDATSRILEIGCSSGITLFGLAPLSGLYYGIDLSASILDRTRAEVERRGLSNVVLERRAADEIDALPERGFDLVVINSVAQNWNGHNYLRDVIRKAASLLRNGGRIFVGDVMDQERKDALVESLASFARENAGAGYTTKLDWSDELFIARAFWDDLRHDIPSIARVEHSEKLGTIRNELTEFRYDTILHVSRDAREPLPARAKVQLDRKQLDACDDAPLPSRAHAEKLAYILYTSGTTGRPKGVAVGHRSLTNYIQWAARYYFGDGGGSMPLFTSPAFDLTLTSIFTPLILGRSVHAFRGDDVDRLLERVFLSPHVDAVKLTPAHISVLDGRELTRTRVSKIIAGGEDLKREHLDALRRINPAVRVFNEYGPTEATVGCTIREVGEGAITIGTPIDNARVYIVGSDGDLKPVGVPGELCVSGDCLALGYWNDPELTARKFIDHPFRAGEKLYRTGDRARWTENGELVLEGRIDQQVKIRGTRIELGEIESLVRRVPGVRDVTIVDRPDSSGEKALCAYVIAEGTVSADAIQHELRRALPEYMVPAYYVFLERFPLTANGKLDRAALPEPEELAATRRSAFVAPRTPLEKALAAAWREVLHLDTAGIDDNFFELGGHSLRATQLVSRIRNRMALEVALREVFRFPTIRALAELLSPRAESSNVATISAVADAESYEVSHAQKRLWVLQQVDGDATAYNVQEALAVRGALDVDALERALSAVVQRFEVLRTAIVARDGVPRQVIHDRIDFRLQRVHAANVDDAHRWIEADAATPFDPETAPLLRAVAIRVAPDEHVVVITMHHLVTDGWSSSIFVRHLLAAYDAELHGRAHAAEVPRVRYRDYAAWHNALVETAHADRDYWLNQLADAPRIELPLDRPRTRVPSAEGGAVTFRLDADIAAGLQRIASAHGATMFIVLLAAVKTLLHRYSGQEDLVVGSPVAGRIHPDLEDEIGFFTNTLALRTRIDAARSFSDLLERVKATALDAFEHQAYPFDKLVSELSLPRDTTRTPLFDVLFVLQNNERASAELDGIHVTPLAAPVTTAKFDLSFFFSEEEGCVAGTIEYRAAQFNRETVERFVSHLSVLAAAIVSNPEQAVAALPLMREQERELVTSTFAGAASVTEAPDVVTRFVEHAIAQPHDLAVIDATGTLTYGELHERVLRVSAWIAERTAPGDVVAVTLPRGSGVVTALLATLHAGCVYAYVDAALPVARVEYMLRDSAARLLIAQSEMAAALASTSHGAPRDVMPGDAAYIVYTSGSTGRPKGVIGTRRCLANLVRWQATTGVSPHCASYASLGFDVAVQEIVFAMAAGGSLSMPTNDERLDPRRLITFLDRNQVETLFVPFAALNVFIAEVMSQDAAFPADRQRHGLSEGDPSTALGMTREDAATDASNADAHAARHRLRHLRTLITAGEQLRLDERAKELLRRRPWLELHNQYGPSETHVATSYVVSASRANLTDLPPIGTPIGGARVWVVDKLLQPVPIGVAGELLIGGVPVANGYVGDGALTAEKFIAFMGERVYRTGDLCRWLPNGELEFLGRIDTQIKVRGYRVEPAEIEQVMQSCGVAEAAVVIAASQQLAAFFTAAERVDVASLRASMRRSLPEYMIPTRIEQLETLPKTNSGKIDRLALAALPLAGHTQVERSLDDATETERAIAELYALVLNRDDVGDDVGLDDDFFELGGHSLVAVQLAARIRERFSVDLPLLAIFEHTTVRSLAQRVDALRGGAHAAKPYALLNRPAERRLFAMPPILGYGIALKRLADRVPEVALYAFDYVEDTLERYADWIDEVQPSGPVTLFGYSAGGVLAFELARLLESRGRTVADILFFDSFRPNGGPPPADDAVEREVASNLEYFSTYIEREPHMRALVTDAGMREALVQKMASYIRAHARMSAAGTVGANLHLITSGEFADDPRHQAWAGATSARLDIYRGSGPHTDMLFDEHVEHNAALVREILARRVERDPRRSS